MMRTRTMAVVALGISGLVVSACGTNRASESGGEDGGEVSYPERRIQMIVPYPAGGATDAVGRLWSQCLEGEMGQTITVVNREGGQGGVGTAFVAQAEPDGYTLEIAPESPMMVLPETVEDVGYTYEDLDYVAMLGRSPDVFYVRPDSRFQTIDDLVAALRSADAPRGALYSPAATPTMRGASMAEKNGFTWEVVPYDSAADLTNAVVAGDAEFAYSGISIPMIEQLRAGNLRLLAAAEDVSLIEEGIPTMDEVGLEGFDGPEADLIFLAGPAGLPDEVVGVLEEAVAACRDDPSVSEALPVQFLPDEGTTGDALDEVVGETQAAYSEYLAQASE